MCVCVCVCELTFVVCFYQSFPLNVKLFVDHLTLKCTLDGEEAQWVGICHLIIRNSKKVFDMFHQTEHGNCYKLTKEVTVCI